MSSPTNLKINGETQLYGLIGDPISHSKSPVFQNAAFAATSINAIYFPFHIHTVTEQLKTAFNQLSVCGFNVTLPHKTAIIPLLDEIDPKANYIQSVNTVVIKQNKWKGYTTDGEGFIRNLADKNFEVTGKTVQLLGAGGSTAAIAYALLDNKVKKLYISNRTPSKTEALIQRLKSKFDVPILPGSCPNKYDLLINTTSAGLNENVLPCNESLIKNSGFVSDIIYKETPLLKKAAEYAIPCQNGLGMLLYQGAVSFTLWTGRQAPVFTMKTALYQTQN